MKPSLFISACRRLILAGKITLEQLEEKFKLSENEKQELLDILQNHDRSF